MLVSSIFVPDGTIVSTHGRTQNQDVRRTGDALPRHPMVVLINGDTASASEIVTAALEQSGLAKVVGTTSFGKGTFQEVIPLNNGGALDLTVGEYLTRDGTSINGTGIAPQVRAKDNPNTSPTRAAREPPGAGSTALTPSPAAERRVVLVSKRGRFLVGELLFERGGRVELGGGRRGRRHLGGWRWSSSAGAAAKPGRSRSSAIPRGRPT